MATATKKKAAGTQKKTTKTAAAKAHRPAKKGAKLPTPKEVAAFVGLTLKPHLTPPQIQKLRRGLPGYVNILDDVADLIEEDAIDLNLKEVTPAGLLDAQARQKEMSAREAVLEAAYVSAYHQRMLIDDEAIGMLRIIARRIQSRAEENPDLLVRYKAMLDYLATFHGGRRSGSGKNRPASASTEG